MTSISPYHCTFSQSSRLFQENESHATLTEVPAWMIPAIIISLLSRTPLPALVYRELTCSQQLHNFISSSNNSSLDLLLCTEYIICNPNVLLLDTNRSFRIHLQGAFLPIIGPWRNVYYRGLVLEASSLCRCDPLIGQNTTHRIDRTSPYDLRWPTTTIMPTTTMMASITETTALPHSPWLPRPRVAKPTPLILPLTVPTPG